MLISSSFDPFPEVMEDSKKVYRYFGKPGEDFHLWQARTEAALQAKEVLYVVESDILGTAEDGNLTEGQRKDTAIARAVLIQGMGDRPLRLCLSAKENPYRMWVRLRERYAVSNTATKVQMQSKLTRMSYTGQPMQDYIDAFEEIFNRLAAMESDVAEDLQVAMVLASFGDKNKSSFGHVLAALQTIQEKLDWETVTASLLQEYEEQLLRSGSSKGKKTTDE